MEWLRAHIKAKPNLAMSIPTFLCFVQFIASIVDIIKTKTFSYDLVVQLLSSLDGVETLVLFVVMMALKDEKK